MQIGDAPVMISRDMLLEIAPAWDKAIRTIRATAAADILDETPEYFAFAITVARPKGEAQLVKTHKCMMNHPPFQRGIMLDINTVRFTRFSCLNPLVSCALSLLLTACCWPAWEGQL